MSAQWKLFEKKVAELFTLFGYNVIHDTKINAAQTDILSTSPNRFKPNLLIECKFHSESSRKVSINEVENFTARVITLRNTGKVDHGYLITNTDFTSSAKESINEFSTFVFLSSYDQLLQNLVDIDFYLKEFVRQYEEKKYHDKFVDLHVSIINDIKEKEQKETSKLLLTKPTGIGKTDKAILETDKAILAALTLFNAIIPESYPRPKDLRSVIESIENFVSSDKKFLLLLGDYGGGKSTCFNQYMYLAAKKKLDDPANINIPYPILINLRDYNKAVDFDSLLINFFENELGYSNINLKVFKRMNSLGYFTLILDGFDEMSKLVTPIERRLTFQEISKQITTNNKILLSSRLGYFPSDKEMISILCRYLKKPKPSVDTEKLSIPETAIMMNLELMDSDQLSDYLAKNSAGTVMSFLEQKELSDLARRPILTNIIIETLDELKSVPNNTITLNLLYDLYVNKWILREEDKGFFRILIDEKSKVDFLSLLAIQMHETDELEIHYSELDSNITEHFRLTEKNKIDHFSHDIRTCSFLTRDDKGNYKFIHKSFMEYFVAREFNRYKNSKFKGPFKNPFTYAIWDFIDDTNLPQSLRNAKLKSDQIREMKNDAAKERLYESAARLRDAEKKMLYAMQVDWPEFMETDAKVKNEIDRIIESCQAEIEREKASKKH